MAGGTAEAGLRLLVIEDQRADFLLLERHLAREGVLAGCRWVQTEAELAAALDENGWDAVLSDYTVPGMEFSVTLARLQERLPGVPVVLVSGSVGEEQAVELLKQGVWDFVLKDNLARLVPALVRALREAEDRRARDDAEAALRASEGRFRSYMEHAPMAVLVLDGAGKCLEANRAAEILTGRGPAELLAASLLDAVAADDRTAAEGHFAALVSEGRCEVECRLARPDGRIPWASLRAVRIAPDRYLAFATDISKRKEAEERLRLAAAVFNSTQEGVAVAAPDGSVVAVNAAFTTITEYAEAEVLGRNLRLLSSGRHDRDFYRDLWRNVSDAGYWQGEIWNRRKGGEVYPQWLTLSAVKDEAGRVVNYVGVFTDISRIKHPESHLEHLAHHDALTDLPNRLLLLSRLNHSLDRVRRRGGRGAVLFLDLDGFKAVNDRLGHEAGDELLRQVSVRLQHRLREADTLARLGGDEFVVVLEDLPSRYTAAAVAQDVVDRLQEPFELPAGPVRIGGSVGICLFPNDGDSAEELIRKADMALYDAKAAGRGTWRFHDPVSGMARTVAG